MRRNAGPWARVVAVVLALLLGPGLAIPPALAAEAPAAKPSTLAASAEVKVAALDTSAAVAPVQAPAAPGEAPSKSFFKTGKGAAALVLMIGIAGYTVYSRADKAIHSPAREK